MTVVESGKISLYQLINITTPSMGGVGTSTTAWFVSKGSNIVTLLKYSGLGLSGGSRKQRENSFVEMIKDNEEVYDKYIARKDFGLNKLSA